MSLSRKSVALDFAAHFVASGVGATGLTVTVDVWDVTAATEIVTGASATELGDGLYKYSLAASANDADRAHYVAVFKTSGTADQQELAASWTVDQTFLAAVNAGSATFVSAVEGETLTAYLSRTWKFTNASAGQSVDSYETLVFSVKKDLRLDTDAEAILRVHSVNGLERIGEGAPVSSSNGTLSGTGSTFSVWVADAETDGSSTLLPGRYSWSLIGIDTTPTPDDSFELATGTFTILDTGYIG